jgi:hypothetical protein
VKHDKQDGEPIDQSYDMIIIGTGAKAKAATRALNEEGQNVMLIELSPDMIASMVCHHPPKNSSPSHKYEQELNTDSISQKIQLRQQTVSTPAGTTITYTFHVAQEEPQIQAEVDSDSTAPYRVMHESTESSDYDPATAQFSWSEEPEPEVEVVETTTARQAAANGSIMDIKNMFFNSNGIASFSNSPQDDDDDIEDVEAIEIDPVSHTREITNDYITLGNEDELEKERIAQRQQPEEDLSQQILQKLKPSSLSQQREQEISMREQQLFTSQDNPTPQLFPNFQQATMNTQPSMQQADSDDFEEEGLDRSSFLRSVLNKPAYTPNETRLRKRSNQKLKKEPSISQDTDVGPRRFAPPPRIAQQSSATVDPMTTRRRARAQKKSRILSTGEQQIQSNSQTTPQEELQTQPNPGSFQPFVQQPTYSEPEEQQQLSHEDEFATDSFEQVETSLGGSTLKHDEIEFEDPYGFDSWEEFMHPPSGRKRQEDDEVKKRKAALRGLHNLINNLG